MAVQVSDLTFSFSVSNFSELGGIVYTPVFSSSDSIFWQLSIRPETYEKNWKYYSIFVIPVPGQDGFFWNLRSKLSISVFAKEHRDNDTHVLYANSLKITHSDFNKREIEVKAFKKTLLRSGGLTFGLRVKSFKYDDERCEGVITLNPVPKSLTLAWSNHMRGYKVDDVEFNVKGTKFYVCSSILANRSKYFRNMLSGEWSETSNVQNNENIEQSTSNNDIIQNDTEMEIIEEKENSSTKDDSSNKNENECDDNSSSMKDDLPNGDETECDDNSSSIIDDDLSNESEKNFDSINEDDNGDIEKNTIKYHITVSDCDAGIFGEMLSYLYTNQINWNNKNDDSFIIGLFCLADKYQLHDLRQRAKNKLIDELDTINAADIMFDLVPKYDDLKKPVLEFTAKNFKAVSKSSGFKYILANPDEYLDFDEIMSEVLEEHFKVHEK
ncbi:hypothetical protein C1645_821282 [Glomus cerebriforme]|uniref:BTB domain-containing protein n=1 Tax=Glomus cerebriforme TaxID=658196 RepID=A0A397T6Q9_9GLOM|nr:hypothetical protein C1645_821282 [Glomus cerebriforme]